MSFEKQTGQKQEGRARQLRALYVRIKSQKSNLTLTDSEAMLLADAIHSLAEKESSTTPIARSTRRKPMFLPIVIVLSSAYFFAFFANLVLSTSLATALIASCIGLLVGIAAVKLDPTMKGYWLHDVD